MKHTLMSQLLVVVFLALAPISAQSRETGARYDDLLAKVKSGNLSVDFREMRLAYAGTSHYKPYGGGQAGIRDAMFAAMAAKDYAAAVENAEKVMADNYVDIDAHMIASIAYDRLGKEKNAGFHRSVVRGLVASILDSGDGRTPETAYTVISIDEEYVILYILGLTMSRQADQHLNGHSYDKLDVSESKTGKQFELFFSIDVPYNWLQKSLKN